MLHVARPGYACPVKRSSDSGPDQHVDIPASRQPWTEAAGRRLRDLRHDRGLRQGDLAELIGQPRTVLSNYENAVRHPNPAALDALAKALAVTVESLTNADRPVAEHTPWPVLQHLLPEQLATADLRRAERFVEMAVLFDRLATAEIAAFRWQHLLATAEHARATLLELDTPGNSSARKQALRDAGATFARHTRSALSLGDGPLPPDRTLAELCGLRLFTLPLRPSPQALVGGIAAPLERIGVAVLVNDFLPPSQRLAVLVRVLGSTLLNPRPIVVRSATGRAGRQPAATAILDAFVEEFILPTASIQSRVQDVHRISLQQPSEPIRTELGWQLISGLVRDFRAVAASVQARLDSPLPAPVPPSPPARPRGDDQYRIGEPGIDDLPAGFVHLLMMQILQGRSSVDGVAAQTGINPARIEAHLRSVELADPESDYAEFSVA